MTIFRILRKIYLLLHITFCSDLQWNYNHVQTVKNLIEYVEMICLNEICALTAFRVLTRAHSWKIQNSSWKIQKALLVQLHSFVEGQLHQFFLTEILAWIHGLYGCYNLFYGCIQESASMCWCIQRSVKASKDPWMNSSNCGCMQRSVHEFKHLWMHPRIGRGNQGSLVEAT